LSETLNLFLHLADLQKKFADMHRARYNAIQQVQDNWGSTVNKEADIPIPLNKKDMSMELFGIGWLPYYLVWQDGQLRKFAAYPAAQN
jgi:hypothetical protein